MTATPGTQIGVDGRRVPVADLPTLSAEEVVEAQRLATLRLPEAVVGKTVDEERAGIAAPAPGTAQFDALVLDDDLSAELEANATYAFDMTLFNGASSGTADIFMMMVIPDGASGQVSLDGVTFDLRESDDPAREAYQLGYTTPNVTQHVGFVQTGPEGGTFGLAWQPFGTGGIAVRAGSSLRLTKI